MLTSTDYLMAWSIYLLSAVVLMLTVWRMSAHFWGWVKDMLRVGTAALLLTPAPVDGDTQHLAPALFNVVFELLSAPEGGTGALLGVRVLLIMIIAVLTAWLLRFLWYWLVLRGRTAEEPAPQRPVRRRLRPEDSPPKRV